MNENHLASEKIAIMNEIKFHERAFIAFIDSRLGINIDHCQLGDLQKTIYEACKKFNCMPKQYLEMLRASPDQSERLEHLITGITVGETYFFRDKLQMELLQHKLLPEMIKWKRAKKNLSLRIWSAGCATGEEIYTIAMMLYELLPDIDQWVLNLLGTDINTNALQKAIKGHYNKWSMRSISDEHKSRYFSYEHNHYIINDKIKQLVNFDYLNLNDNTYPSIFSGTNSQDLIICRNVLIYFNSDHVEKIMDKLYGSLSPGAYLLLGASDPFNIKTSKLIFHQEPVLFFSRSLTDDKMTESSLAKKSIPTIVIPLPLSSNLKIKSPSVVKEKPITPDEDAHILDLMSKSLWQTILDLVKSDEGSDFVLSAKVMALANLGHLDEASKLCQKMLAKSPTNKDIYFMYALILLELNLLTGAETAFKKTIFLDHEFVAAHYQLGLLLLRNQRKMEGLKSLKNALMMAKVKHANEKVEGSNDLNYGQLTEILKHELDIYHQLGDKYGT